MNLKKLIRKSKWKMGFVSCLWSRDVDLWSFEHLDSPWLIWIFKLIHKWWRSCTATRWLAKLTLIWKHDWDKNYIENCISKILRMLFGTLDIIMILDRDFQRIELISLSKMTSVQDPLKCKRLLKSSLLIFRFFSKYFLYLKILTESSIFIFVLINYIE